MRVLFVFAFALSVSPAHSQVQPEYFISNTDSGLYLIHGTRLLIKTPESACFEYVESSQLTKGRKYIILRIFDEMLNGRGVLIFDKKGNQIRFEAVQDERAKFYEPFNCCVYVEELKGKLYFWDYLTPDDEAYDCYYDSQTDASDYQIPRYYILEPKTGTVETKSLSAPCTTLIENGQVICE